VPFFQAAVSEVSQAQLQSLFKTVEDSDPRFDTQSAWLGPHVWSTQISIDVSAGPAKPVLSGLNLGQPVQVPML